MSPTLLLVEPRDRLAAAIFPLLSNPVVPLAPNLFPAQITIDKHGRLADSCIESDVGRLRLDALRGVVFRRRTLGHDLGVRTSDSAFIRHERRAAWCALLSLVPCMVANRVDTLWFIAAPLFAFELADRLAEGLDLDRSRGLSKSASSLRVYFVGSTLLYDDRFLETEPVVPRSRLRVLERWCLETGILHGRADFDRVDGRYALRSVDPMPAMTEASQSTVDRVAQLMAERLQS